jgi:5-methylthioadenosine/S-adenosylhomocysteine deaminase
VPYVADEVGYEYFETLESNRCLWRVTPWRQTDGFARGLIWSTSSTCTPETVRAAGELASVFDTDLHVHSSEIMWEVQESLRRYGRRPIERLFDLNVLGSRSVIFMQYGWTTVRSRSWQQPEPAWRTAPART